MGVLTSLWGGSRPAAAGSAARALAVMRGLRILFSSKDDWEPALRDAFSATRHRLIFATLAEQRLNDHDVLIPLTLSDLEWAAAVPTPGMLCPWPVPDLRVLRLCNDKLAFNRALVDAGFSAFLPGIERPYFYPYILKKRIDEWGANSVVVGSWQHEQRLAPLIGDPDYFCQEFVPGTREYATHILFDGDRIVHELTIEYEFQERLCIKGRSELRRMGPVASPGCLAVFARILGRIGFRGLCCVNYKLDGTRPLIFEINPRPGASVCPYLPQFLWVHATHATPLKWLPAGPRHRGGTAR